MLNSGLLGKIIAALALLVLLAVSSAQSLAQQEDDQAQSDQPRTEESSEEADDDTDGASQSPRRPDPNATRLAPSRLSATPPNVSQKQAVELARNSFSGDVISISERMQPNGLRYRIRMDNEGKIFTVYVEASSGNVSRE